ncbi:MAG: putative membrane protein [Planctomycetota bacterium]|jgi:uncharacterized membrane protein
MHREGTVGFTMCSVTSWLDCAAAHTSRYGYAFQVPVGWIGLFYYLWIGVLSFIGLLRPSARHRTVVAIQLVSLLALGYSIYMAGVLIFIVRGLCLICVITYLLNIAITTCTTAIVRPGLVGATSGPWQRVLQWPEFVRREWLNRIVMGYLLALLVILGTGIIGARSAIVLSDRDIQLMDAMGRFYQSPSRELEVPADVPHWGTEGAPIRVVLFSDFQCPVCVGVKGVLEEYEAHLDVAFLHYPLDPSINPAVDHNKHPSAGVAARGAVLAHSLGAFWEYYDDLFRNQRLIDRDFVIWWLTGHGFASDGLRAALRNDSTVGVVARDLRLAADWGVVGTPTLFVNGRRMDLFAEPLLHLILRQELSNCGVDLAGH